MDAVIAPYGVFVRPVVHGLSRLAESLHTSPFDADEKKAWSIAGGAVLYQEGLESNAWMMLGLCAFGTIIPRVTEYAENARKDRIEAENRRLELLGEPAPNKEAGPPQGPRAVPHGAPPPPPRVGLSVADQASRAIGGSLKPGFAQPDKPETAP